MKPVAVVAHRGSSGTHPENTAAAFGEAVRLCVESIELDVHRSRDGGLIVIHDDTVDRTSDGEGRVADLTLAQIRALDGGAWFAPAFAGEPLLVLEEALELIPPTIRLNVHIKALAEDRDDLCGRVVAALRDADRLATAFIAGDEPTLAAARQHAPAIDICNLSTQPAADYVERSERIGCRILQPGHAMTTPQLVDAAHQLGMEVNPFYADEEGQMRRLIACGVDGILTNQPERLQRLREADAASPAAAS